MSPEAAPQQARTIVLPALLDRDRRAIGGTATFVCALERALRGRGLRVIMLGAVGRDVASGSAGQTQADVDFVPVVDRSPARGRDLAWALWRRRGRWHFPADAVVHVQRPDFALGFLKGPWPVVVTFHGRHQRSWRARGVVAGWLYSLIEHTVCGNADALVFVAQTDQEDVAGTHALWRAKSRHVPLPVDREFYTPGDPGLARRELGFGLDVPAVAFVGRLEPEKRVPALIRACADLDCELWIAGDGREAARCQREAGERVRFLGPLDRKGVRRLLRAADVLALASAYEGLPSVVLEAWACGLPVVAPPVGDLPALLGRGGGVLAAGGTAQEIAAALRAALGTSRTADSRERIRALSADFAWERITERWLEVYAAAIHHRQHTRLRSRS